MVLMKQLFQVNQLYMPQVMSFTMLRWEHVFTEGRATYEMPQVHQLQLTFHHAPEKSSYYSKPDLGQILNSIRHQ